MTTGKAIYGKLSTDPTITALCAIRIYPAKSPQEQATYPLVIYAGDGGETIASFSGPSGLRKEKITVGCIGRTYASMDALSAAVRNSLDNESGTWGGVVVQGCFFEDEREDHLSSEDTGEQFELYMKEMDFTLWFNT